MIVTQRGVETILYVPKRILNWDPKPRKVNNTFVIQFATVCNFLSLGNNGICAMKT